MCPRRGRVDEKNWVDHNIGDGMGEGARDGTADNTQDPPLGASMDTAHNKGVDDKGDE